MTNRELALFQFCDSNFPTGAFSHSFGLESYIQRDEVHDDVSFATWLEIYLSEQLVHSDGLAARMAYDALTRQDQESFWDLDRKLTIQNLAAETRHGTKQMGERMAKLSAELYPIQSLSTYYKRIKEKKAFGHPSLVFTMLGHHLEVKKETTILYYLYSTITSLIQNAVRAIPLGQTKGQLLIRSFQPKLTEAVNRIMELEEIDFGVVSPGMELSQMQHERVNIRIFMS